jgi:hypothetical protein
LGAGGVGSISANSDAQDVPSFRRWRFVMKLSPFQSSATNAPLSVFGDVQINRATELKIAIFIVI